MANGLQQALQAARNTRPHVRLTDAQVADLQAITRAWNADRRSRGALPIGLREALSRILQVVRSDVTAERTPDK